MNVLQIVRDERPDDAPLDARTRAALRARLVGESTAHRPETFVVDDDVTIPARGRDGGGHVVDLEVADPRFAARGERGRPRAPRRAWVAAAAATVAAVGLAAVWYVTSNRAVEESAAPTRQPDQSGSSSPSQDSTAPFEQDDGWLRVPRVAIEAPGWMLVRAYDGPGPSAGLVVFDPELRFDGPWMSVAPAVGGSEMSFGDERRVPVGSVTGTISSTGEYSSLAWTDPDGNTWWAEGWRVDDATIAELGAAVSTDSGGASNVSSVPAGFEVADAEVGAALSRYAEYGYQRDDGATMQITFYPGGDRAMHGRVGGDQRVSLDADDATLSVSSDGEGRYRANVLRGFWAWEFDGEPFASQDDFVSFVNSVKVVDETTWQASLPDNIVAGDDRVAAIHELLAAINELHAEIPLPEGMTANELAVSDSTSDRYSLISGVSGAVACAWLDQWFDADESGDTQAKAAAAAALATSHEWPMLIEIEPQGGWSGAIWEFADAVNNGPGVLTGAGYVPPTRDLAQSGLGCVFD